MNVMPALFVSHGAPTYALEPGLAGAQLAVLARKLAKPRAIVVISPHWMTRGIQITATERPQTIHDFGGFPRSLYSLQYPTSGDPTLALQIQQRLADQGLSAHLDMQRGLDHGAWVPLLHLYPDADVPTVQVSLPFDTNEAQAFAMGRALAPLAHEGILIIGSGSLTHNLYEVRLDDADAEAAAYAAEFVNWVRQAVLAGDENRLLNTLKSAPHAHRAHPTTEHFLPLLVAAGAGSMQAATVLDGGIRHGVLAMESYVFGQRLELKEMYG